MPTDPPPEEAALPELLADVIHEEYDLARTRLAHLNRRELRALKGLLADAEWIVGQAIENDVARALGQQPRDWTINGR